MQATVADILEDPRAFDEQIVNVDGILLITGYERAASEFREVWLVQQDEEQNHALRAEPVSSNSTLWHGLSRLNPRHLPGYQSYRVHDAARARVRVQVAANEPRIDILTAAIYRHDFTLYVGVDGVRLDQCLPARAAINALPDIQASIPRYLGRHCHVYGTLVIRSAPPAQFLLPGNMPYNHDPPSLNNRDAETDWLLDIEYPQSDSQTPLDEDALPESVHIDLAYELKDALAVLPGITQTVVKPAIVAGTLGARDHELHFATLTDIEQVYLQNITFSQQGKMLESVLKLKNLEPAADAD